MVLYMNITIPSLLHYGGNQRIDFNVPVIILNVLKCYKVICLKHSSLYNVFCNMAPITARDFVI